MFIIMGATGHVGGATARTLLDQGEPTTVIVRDSTKASVWKDHGAEVVAADVSRPDTLRDAFRKGRRAFLLNPPADTTTDTDKVERESAANILSALEGSGLEVVVAESTYGAQPGDRIGDLSVLYELEQGLRAQSIPSTLLRAAYYMSNWDALLDRVRDTGVLPSMLPADLKIPMVAPEDLGKNAARLLREPVSQTRTVYVEGPERYSAEDVARAFAMALGRDVHVEVTPRDQWEAAYRELGFSAQAADSFARMTAVTVAHPAKPDAPVRGTISLQDYVASLVSN